MVTENTREKARKMIERGIVIYIVICIVFIVYELYEKSVLNKRLK